MTQTSEYLQELVEQKSALAGHLIEADIDASRYELYNALIAKVGAALMIPRTEYNYNSSGNLISAKLCYLKEIPNYVFYNQTNLTSVELHKSSIGRIGDYAFYSTKLSSFSIPDTVTYIGTNAFYKCPISNIVIPDTGDDMTISTQAFAYTSIKSIDIPSRVKTLTGSCFYYCKSLKSITLPETEVTMGSYMFSYSGLTSFAFPSWFTDIPENFFYCCYSLNITSLPQGITTIGNAAFQATACTFTNIPDSVTKIGNRAFIAIKSTSLNIPSSVTSLGVNLLGGTASVVTMRIGCGVPNNVITDSANKNTTLKYVEVNGDISYTAFQGCTGLLKVWIRETCTTIKTMSSATYKPFYGSSNVVIYAEADSKPDGWADDFNKISSSASATVIYGVKESPF